MNIITKTIHLLIPKIINIITFQEVTMYTQVAATKKSGVNLKAKHTTNQDLIIFTKYLTYIKSKSVRVNIVKFYNVAKESL